MFYQAALPLFSPLPLTGESDPDLQLLEKLRETALRGQPTTLSITAKSPSILKELDLLVELDRRHSVTVDVPVPANPDLAQPLLKTVARLAAEGIAARVVCSPEAQGIDGGEKALRRLFAAAREAGAWDVAAEASPKRFRFTRRRKDRDLDALATFRRLRLEYGFPQPVAGRG